MSMEKSWKRYHLHLQTEYLLLYSDHTGDLTAIGECDPFGWFDGVSGVPYNKLCWICKTCPDLLSLKKQKQEPKNVGYIQAHSNFMTFTAFSGIADLSGGLFVQRHEIAKENYYTLKQQSCNTFNTQIHHKSCFICIIE